MSKPYEKAKDLTADEKVRFKEHEDVDESIDGVDTLVQKPIFLDETGCEKDLQLCKERVRDHLLKKILNATVTPEELARYNAIKND